jgi:S1-C subfamily serine protease
MAALVLAVAAACSTGGAPAAPPLAATAERSDVVGRVVACTVQLRSERDGGAQRAASGVVIASDPQSRRVWIVTARHFLDPPTTQRLYVRVPGHEDVVQGEIVLASRDHDLAVIVADVSGVAPARLKQAARLGDAVLVVTFPWGQRFTVVSGIVSQIAGTVGQIPLAGDPALVDATVNYGSSGGGVFDARSGELIAIVESYRTAKVAIPTMEDRPIQLPVAGETSVLAAATILRVLGDTDLKQFLAR